jgi:hypothetical protein
VRNKELCFSLLGNDSTFCSKGDPDEGASSLTVFGSNENSDTFVQSKASHRMVKELRS